MAAANSSKPDVWELHIDRRNKLPFYYNVVTGRSAWSLPDDRWHKARDLASGRYYYFNLRWQEATWAEPVGYKEEDFSKCYVLPYDQSILGLGPGREDFEGHIPAFDPTRGIHYWHSYEETIWKKPRNTDYSLADVSTRDQYDALETRAKLLQSYIHNATDEVNRLGLIEEQIRETVLARQKKVDKMKGLRRKSSTKKLNMPPGVARYLESSLGHVGLRASVKTSQVTVDSFLRSVPLFHSLNEAQFAKVKRNLQTQTFSPKEVIIRQDTRGDLFYLIQEGKVRIYQAGVYTEEQGFLPEDTAFGKMVNELSAGDYFGERSLLTDKLRCATIVALTHVTCFTLHRSIFNEVIDKTHSVETSNSALTHSNDEISSFAKHVNNYDTMLSLKRKAATLREERVADALMKLMTAFSPELNVEDTVERMTKTLYPIFNCERVSVYNVDMERKVLLLKIGQEAQITNKKIELPIGKGIAGHCAASNKIVNVPHVSKSEHFYGKVDRENGFTTRSVLCCPVCTEDGTVISVIQLINKRGGGPFSAEDELVLASVSEQMSLTLAHQKAEWDNDHSLSTFIPIWKKNERLSVTIKRFLGASLPGHVVSNSIIVSATVYYAGDSLAETRWVQATAERLTPYMITNFDERVKLDLKLHNLPRAARLIFNVYYGKVNLTEVDIFQAGSLELNESEERYGSTSEEDSRRGRGGRRKRDPNLANTVMSPIGWAGCYLFDFDQVLRTGHLRLKLFRGECSPALAAATTLLNNTTTNQVDFLELQFPSFDKPVLYTDYISKRMKDEAEKIPANSRIYKMMKEEIDLFIHQDPLKQMTHDQKLLVMQTRHELMHNPEALPKFLRSIPWNKRASIQLAYKYLNKWTAPGPVVALQLLDFHYPDPKVRALAVSSLETLDDDELQLYLLQLTQVIKFERFVDSALSRFLLRRALKSPQTVGQRLFWLLKSEMHIPTVTDRYGALLDSYLRHLRGGGRAALGHQMYVLNKLEGISRRLTQVKNKERTPNLQDSLRNLVLPEEFELPIIPDRSFRSINVQSARCMNSKKAPLMLEFISSRTGAAPYNVLFKAGDDLRQDQLTLQVLSVMDRIWKQEGLDMRLNCYATTSTGDQTGMIQVVTESETIASITASGGKSKLAKAVKVFDDRKLKRWLSNNGFSRKVTEQNFCYSTAGYCVATYVLGIGDRHNDNIMLTKDGRLFHIDFGHFLGNFKSKYGVKRERSPFVFTPAMAAVLGKPDKALFQQFEALCCRAFNILRRKANLLITLFSLMLSCGLPELKTESDLDWLREKLMLDATEDEAAEKFRQLIVESLHSIATQINDFSHLLRRG